MATISSPLATLSATPSAPLTQATIIATKTIVLTVPTLLSPSLTNPALVLDQHTGGLSHPNKEQITTIWLAGVMILCILIGWNMFLIRTLLYPWKMLTNLVHEMNHVFVAILTGANVYSINIDPDTGPISGMTGGQPLMILSAGYLGSILVGSALILSSFDTSASKVASLAIFPLFIVCFWFGRTWARLRILVCVGLSIGIWFIDGAHYLRFYILFIGVMNAFYVLWDALDDLLFRKENESDAALFARMTSPHIHAWVLIWLFITLAFVSLGIVGGLHFFDKSAEAQQEAQRTFLPT